MSTVQTPGTQTPGTQTPGTQTSSAPPLAPSRPEPTGLALMRDGFAVLAVVALWVLVQLLLLSSTSQARAQYLLYGELRGALAAATAPTGGAIDPGTPVALLTIPALGLNEVVVEGTASGDLRSGPGHRRDTVLPGQRGVALVYGRASTYGGPFRHLADLRVGDEVRTQTAQGPALYKVTGLRRAGDPLPAPVAADGGRLTLVSAEGTGRLAVLSPHSVLYVDATLAGTAFTPPPGRPAAVPASEIAMASDPGALPLLVLLLALVIALAAGVVVARRRFPGIVVWVVATPPVVALAWATTDVAVRLLPNLL